MSPRQPRRTLADWRPDSDQDEQDWLAAQYDAGWVPDPLYGGAPATVSVDGNPPVHRWAMVQIPDDNTPQPSW
ncbi:hypothetical protein [Tessaracoccus sp.]